VAAEFRSSIEASESFLLTATKLEDETKARLRQRAEEARQLATTADSAIAQSLLLELADGYDSLASFEVA
jgi:hypothetical protein